MNYKIITQSEDELFIEVTRATFRTRIVFDFVPDKDFYGIAVGCNYSFKGNPVGFLKDNGLIIKSATGHKNRAIFQIETDTIIQAGPSLIINKEPQRDYKKENFSSHQIVSGFHVHIGKKQSGNYVVGFTEKSTFNEIIKKYEDLFIEEAIKLPGHKNGSFYFRSTHQEIKQGLFPVPIALVFESKLNKSSNIFGEVL